MATQGPVAKNPCGEASEGEIRMRCGVFIVRGVLGFCSGEAKSAVETILDEGVAGVETCGMA
ncbi:hypothetical protein U1Q18_050708 [Sarracenia purpurea var. burkii]